MGGEGECGGGKMETTVLEQQQKAQNLQILNLKKEREKTERDLRPSLKFRKVAQGN